MTSLVSVSDGLSLSSEEVLVSAHTATRLSPVPWKSSWLRKNSAPPGGVALWSPGGDAAGCSDDHVDSGDLPWSWVGTGVSRVSKRCTGGWVPLISARLDSA